MAGCSRSRFSRVVPRFGTGGLRARQRWWSPVLMAPCFWQLGSVQG